MKRVIIKYGVGYGRHTMDLEFEDDATEAEIESDVEVAVTERLEWSWQIEDAE